MTVTLQQLFNSNGDSLCARYRLSRDMRYAIERIRLCRTSILGGHANRCKSCGGIEIAYNSCLHRCCPQCAWLPRERWLHAWKARLLPVGHHHIVFTVPHLLNELWRFNRREFANVLFSTVSETLLELLSDAQFLGARPGILTALHTWNQKLLPHIHLHAIVTAGGLNQEKRWVEAKKSCLLPRKVVMLKFRGKFLFKIKEAFQSGKLKLPPESSDQRLDALIKQCRSKVWNVKIHNRYDQAGGVATYLARYVKGGPCGNKRLLGIADGRVKFRYRMSTLEGGDGKKQVDGSLPIETFLLRWLTHVPPRRFQTIRGYGLYGGNQHSRLADARASLGVLTPEVKDQDQPKWEDLLDAAGCKELRHCRKCGGEMECIAELGRCRSPPCRRPTESKITPKVTEYQEVA